MSQAPDSTPAEPPVALPFRRRVAYMALLAWGAPLLLEGKALLGEHVFWGSAISRDAYCWCLYRAFERRCLMEGELPLWNPYALNGLPWQSFLTNLLHPGTLLLWLCPDMGWLFKITLWWSLGWACLGMAAWCWWRGCSWPAAAIAGLVFAHGGFTISHLYAGHLDLLVTLVWAPWLGWALEAAMRWRGWGWTMLAGGVLGCTMASGHWPTLYLILWTMGLYSFLSCLWETGSVSRPCLALWSQRAQAADLRERLAWWSLRWLLVSLMGLLLGLHQLVPQVAAQEWGNRPIYDEEFFTSFSVRSWALLNYLLPHFFDGSNNLGFWPAWPVWEGHDYLSLLGLALAGLAMARQPRQSLPVAAVVVLSWVLGLDGDCRALRLYANWGPDPLVTAFRDPGRFLLAGHLLIPLWMARGVDLLLTDPAFRPPLLRVLQALIGMLLAFFLLLHSSNPGGASPWSWVLDQIAGHDGVVSYGLNRPELEARLTVAQYWRVSVALVLLLLQLAAVRICGRGRGRQASVALLLAVAIDLFCFVRPWMTTAESGSLELPPGFSSGLPQGETTRIELSPRWLNQGPAVGWFEHGGYLLAASRAYGLLWTCADGTPIFQSGFRSVFHSPGPRSLRQTQGVGYALVEPNRQSHYPDWRVIRRSEAAILLRAPQLPPRLRFFGHLVERLDEKCIVQLARQPERLQEVAAVAPGVLATLPAASGGSASFHHLEFRPNSVAFTVDVRDGGGLAVLNDAYWPGWVAVVDGKAARVLSVNGGLHRGIFLEPGHHRVAMSYSPSSFFWGVRVSAGVWAGLLLLCGTFFLRLRTFSSQ